MGHLCLFIPIIMFFSLALGLNFSIFVIQLKIIIESSCALGSFSPRFKEIVTHPKAIVRGRHGTWSKVLLTSPTSASLLCYTGPSWCHCGFIYRLSIFQTEPLLSFFGFLLPPCFSMIINQKTDSTCVPEGDPSKLT